ncbi:MAG TPA: site-2 protease family protein [Candidatus Methanofastidiosa archaeon]|nr:site-2 protease family protein [Candidatus Methanofastidiosa archaeon]
MDTLSTVLLSFLAFWALIMLIDQRLDLKRYNIEVMLFQIIARTGRLTGTIDRIAKGIRPIWVIYSIVGVALGMVAMVLTTSNFLLIGRMLFNEPSSATGVQIVIPGVTLPLTYSLVALMVVVIVHEFSHGIIARVNGIKLKSVGVGILAVLPFAFVEPDEDSMKESTPASRIKVLSAGSMANFATAFIALVIIFGLVVPNLSGTGLTIGSVDGEQPGGLAGLEEGMIIESIDYMGQYYEIDDYDAFSSLMDMTSPGDEMSINTNGGTFTFDLGQHPQSDVGYIGISTYDRSVFKDINPLVAFLYPPLVLGIDSVVFPDSFSSVAWFLINCLKYIFFLNVGIGLFNMLPIGPLDGGRVFREITDRLFKGRASALISNAVSVMLVVLIVASLLVPRLF